MALENLTGHAEAFNAFVDPPEQTRQARQWQAWFRGTNWEAIQQDLVKQLASADRDVVRRAGGHPGARGRRCGPGRLANLRGPRRSNQSVPRMEKNPSRRRHALQFVSAEANPRTLQAATRALGYLQDPAAVPILADALHCNSDPEKSNLFLAEAAAEALGRIGTPEAEAGAHQGLERVEGLFLLRRLVRRSQRAIRLPRLSRALLHCPVARRVGFHPGRRHPARSDPLAANRPRPGAVSL